MRNRSTEDFCVRWSVDDPGSGRAGLRTPAGALEVLVTPSSVDRALRIMDALVKALDARGYRVSCAPRPGRPHPRAQTGYPPPQPVMTRVEVGDEDVFVILREVVSRVERVPEPTAPAPLRGPGRRRGYEPPPAPPSSPWKEYEHVGTGRFIVVIPHTPGNYGSSNPAFSWEERNKRKALEDSLGEIVVGIVAAAERFRAWRDRVAANAREEAERARRAAEAERQRLAEAARVQELDRQLAASVKAQQVRDYAAVLRTAVAAAAGKGALPAGAATDWIAWMEAYADRIDPVRRVVRDAAAAGGP